MEHYISTIKNILEPLRGFKDAEEDLLGALSLYTLPEATNTNPEGQRRWFRELDAALAAAEEGARGVTVESVNHDQAIFDKIIEFKRTRREKIAKGDERTPFQRSVDAVKFAKSEDFKRVVELEVKHAKKSQASKIIDKLKESDYIDVHDTIIDEAKLETSPVRGGLLASRNFQGLADQINEIPKVFATLFLPRPELWHSPKLSDHLDTHLTERFKETTRLFNPRILPDLPTDLGRINGSIGRFVVEKQLRSIHKANWFRIQNDLLVLQWILARFATEEEMGEKLEPWLSDREAMDIIIEQFWVSLHVHQSINKIRCENALAGQGKTMGSITNYTSKETPHDYLSEGDRSKLQDFKPRGSGGKGRVNQGGNNSNANTTPNPNYKGKRYDPNYKKKNNEEKSSDTK